MRTFHFTFEEKKSDCTLPHQQKEPLLFDLGVFSVCGGGGGGGRDNLYIRPIAAHLYVERLSPLLLEERRKGSKEEVERIFLSQKHASKPCSLHMSRRQRPYQTVRDTLNHFEFFRPKLEFKGKKKKKIFSNL